MAAALAPLPLDFTLLTDELAFAAALASLPLDLTLLTDDALLLCSGGFIVEQLAVKEASAGVTVRCGPVGRLAVAARRRRSLWRWRQWSARVGTAQAELSAKKEGQSVHFLRDSEPSGVNVFQLPNLWLYSST